MTILEERLPYIDQLVLGRGSHNAPSNGLVEACVMEAVAYVANEPFSDHPECASPILTRFLISWNDSLNDQDRQMLKPYIVRLVGTNTGEADEETRAWMLTDWLARECVPAFLSAAGLTKHARLLEKLTPLVDSKSAKKAQPKLDAARKESAAAWAAAWDAAGDAAGAAAGAAAGDAAGDAAGAAARDAAGAALEPTVKTLQKSALLLLDRMIDVSAK